MILLTAWTDHTTITIAGNSPDTVTIQADRL